LESSQVELLKVMSKKVKSVEVSSDYEDTTLIKGFHFLREDDNRNYSYLQGRLFTLIDALSENDERKKAIKGLIREILTEYSRIVYDQHRCLWEDLAYYLGDEETLNWFGLNLEEAEKTPKRKDW